MSNLFDRPLFDVTLPDGRMCRIQRVGAGEYAEALRAADTATSGAAGVTSSNVKYWGTLCYYGLADPKPESVDAVISQLSIRDLEYVAQRIEFRGDIADDPDKPESQAAWDAKVDPARGEAPTDPLVDEFPAPEHASSTTLGDDAGAVREVSMPAGLGGAEGSDAGDAQVHGSAVHRTAETGVASDG